MKLFLFDIDGTLINTGGVGLRALKRAFKKLFNVPEQKNNVRPHGKTDPAIFREMIETLLGRPADDGDIQSVAERYLSELEIEMGGIDSLEPLPGVQAFLEQLEKDDDILMGLGTGNLEKGARLKLGPTGIEPYFSFGGFGSDAEFRADVLRSGHLRAEEKIGRAIPPSDVYIIGDTPLDIRAAHHNRYHAVAVASGKSGLDELRKDNPAFLLASMEEAGGFYEAVAKKEVNP